MPGQLPACFTRLVGSLVVTSLLLSCSGDSGPSEGPVSGWKVSGAYPADRVARGAYPNFYAIFLASWEDVDAAESGFVELGARVQEPNPNGDLILARRIFQSAEDRPREFTLESSQEVTLFFNGVMTLSHPGSGGTPPPGSGEAVGGAETFSLDVRRGLNEILLMVAGDSPEWGFALRTRGELAAKRQGGGGIEEVWVTPDTFLTPESVLKDPNRDLLYVSNFDNEFARKSEPSGYISVLSLEGEILDAQWVAGLSAPTGMDIWRDTLFVAERESLLAIELESGEIAGRWPIPDPVFPNDLVIDEGGVIYISDTRSNDWEDSRVYRFRDGEFDIFANEGITRANGLWIHEGSLIVGSSGDGILKAVSLETGVVTEIVSLGAGIIDGIRTDINGDLLVSHWEGQVYRIDPAGEVQEILDAMPLRWNTADFEYLPERRLLVIPTFLDNRVRAVRIGSG